MSDPFDRVLRAAARRARTVGVCPDPGMLASYLDNGLTSDERASVEAHAADCPYCQQHLSLLGAVSVERPDPEIAAARPWLVRWGWLVPVATAVLVVAVWTRTPAPVDAPAQFPQREAAPAVVPAPGPPPAADSVSSRPAENRSNRSDDARAVPPPAAKAEADRERKDFAAQTRPQEARPAAPAAAPAPPFPVARDEVGQLSDRPRPPAQAEATGAAAAVREEARLMRKVAAAPIEAVLSERERYRASGGRIERSRDGGVNWEGAFDDGSLNVTVAACAPGGSCWFGTTTGVVLRADGGAFSRSRLPEAAPVTAIDVSSPLAVTVSVGARRYRSSDGTSWTPAP